MLNAAAQILYGERGAQQHGHDNDDERHDQRHSVTTTRMGESPAEASAETTIWPCDPYKFIDYGHELVEESYAQSPMAGKG